jgi:hypothetical protein
VSLDAVISRMPLVADAGFDVCILSSVNYGAGGFTGWEE